MDWQEPRKFDCRLVRTIFNFFLSSINFPKLLASRVVPGEGGN